MEMKIFILSTLFTIVLSYSDIYDKLDYDLFEKDVSLLKSHLDCFMDKAPCNDEESKSVKPHLMQIYADSCRECSDLQKHHGHIFIRALKKILPESYEEFKNMYDKDGKHMSLFEAAVENY